MSEDKRVWYWADGIFQCDDERTGEHLNLSNFPADYDAPEDRELMRRIAAAMNAVRGISTVELEHIHRIVMIVALPTAGDPPPPRDPSDEPGLYWARNAGLPTRLV